LIYVTTEPLGLFASTVRLAGTPVNVGGKVSTNTTVTVNDVVAMFVPSEAVQLTVVVPTGNVDPEGGLQLTTGGFPLLSLAVTE
jgi:hypothetical protein